LVVAVGSGRCWGLSGESGVAVDITDGQDSYRLRLAQATAGKGVKPLT
jgi:hypothetical protein